MTGNRRRPGLVVCEKWRVARGVLERLDAAEARPPEQDRGVTQDGRVGSGDDRHLAGEDLHLGRRPRGAVRRPPEAQHMIPRHQGAEQKAAGNGRGSCHDDIGGGATVDLRHQHSGFGTHPPPVGTRCGDLDFEDSIAGGSGREWDDERGAERHGRGGHGRRRHGRRGHDGRRGRDDWLDRSGPRRRPPGRGAGGDEERHHPYEE